MSMNILWIHLSCSASETIFNLLTARLQLVLHRNWKFCFFPPLSLCVCVPLFLYPVRSTFAQHSIGMSFVHVNQHQIYLICCASQSLCCSLVICLCHNSRQYVYSLFRVVQPTGHKSHTNPFAKYEVERCGVYISHTWSSKRLFN